MSPSKIQGARKVMVWCGIWSNKIVGPVFIDTNLNADIYLNMFTRQHHAVPLKWGRRIPTLFPAGWCTTSLCYLCTPMVESTVSTFLDWSPWPRGVACEIPRCHSTRLVHGVQGKDSEHGSFIGMHLKWNYLHNARCVDTSSPWVGEMTSCVFAKKWQSCRERFVNKVTFC